MTEPRIVWSELPRDWKDIYTPPLRIRIAQGVCNLGFGRYRLWRLFFRKLSKAAK